MQEEVALCLTLPSPWPFAPHVPRKISPASLMGVGKLREKAFLVLPHQPSVLVPSLAEQSLVNVC